MKTTQPLGPAMTGRQLHYRGDLTGQIEGQILGPNTLHEWWVIASTEYDSVTDRTTAHCRVARPEDLRTAVA